MFSQQDSEAQFINQEEFEGEDDDDDDDYWCEYKETIDLDFYFFS